MNPITREFTFLTAAFPHGAYQSQGANQPDLRAPSVKGQLRWWYDALFSDKAAEDLLFGGLKNRMPTGKPGPESSRVIVRVKELTDVTIAKTQFMPHKVGGGEKNAISPGTGYRVLISPRRIGITADEKARLERALDAWLLLGAVGQRANRGAGSIVDSKVPRTVADYEAAAALLLRDTRLRAAVLGKVFQTEKELRFTAGDFLASDAFGNLTPFGSAVPRKPSLLKLRAAYLADGLRLVALWDGRHQADNTLRQGIRVLANHPKEIGQLLANASDKLCPG
jgi:hypothetical protein